MAGVCGIFVRDFKVNDGPFFLNTAKSQRKAVDCYKLFYPIEKGTQFICESLFWASTTKSVMPISI